MRVGIIGGGISGLALSRGLLKGGIECVVFDTGKRGPGGRCSSRLAADTGFPGAVDHAAQYVAAGAGGPFAEFVGECVAAGALRPWEDHGESLFVGGPERGIGGLSEALAAGADLRQDVWVSPNGGIRFDVERDQWVAAKESFDAVVIAHNGKCAERITSKIRSQAVKRLCRAAFGTSPAKGKMTLNSVYSLVFEAPAGAFAGADAAYAFDDGGPLAFLCNQGRKLGWSADTEVWTALSTSAYGKANKHPQEQLRGTDVEKRVVGELLAAAGEKLGGPAPDPLRWRLQLWGAALPLNAWSADDGAGFAWDAASRIGVVGDWFAGGPPPATVEAAFDSGAALAAHLAAAPGEDRGLSGTFVAASTAFSRPARAAAPAPPPKPSTKTADEKRVVKLKKALKRIGQLRKEDYMTLKTEQRVKIHGECAVLEELASLGVRDVEGLRRRLQPGLDEPMPRSKQWSKERDAAREEAAAEARTRAWEDRQRGKLARRKGDWDCPRCNQHNFASRTECYACAAPRGA